MELTDIGIFDWSTISDQFNESAILLGNGFSMNFSSTLAYNNLHSDFEQNCSNEARKLFESFNTTNFEILLDKLDTTHKVLKSIGKDEPQIQLIKEEIRNGLILAINKIHPKPDQINQDNIRKIGSGLIAFDQIFTTNYDLFLYYLILEAWFNENRKFGDYFYQRFGLDTRFHVFNDNDGLNNHHVHYLHGALFFFENSGFNLKLRKGDNWLIEIITNEITSNNYPVFISEGDSESKLRAIKSNFYLSFCYNAFRNDSNSSLVIYGHSLSEQDQHIVSIINGNHNYKQIAVSIRIAGKEKLELIQIKKEWDAKFPNKIVRLFNSTTLFDF